MTQKHVSTIFFHLLEKIPSLLLLVTPIYNYYVMEWLVLLLVTPIYNYYVMEWLLLIHVNLPAGAIFSQFWGSFPSLPSTFKIFRPWKKSSTIKSWPTFCDQYFWKFPIWNSRADEKCREIRMVKVNVIFKWYPVIDLFDTFTGKLGHGD
jgi:hypothetical protein